MNAKVIPVLPPEDRIGEAERAEVGMAKMGMTIFIVSLSILFISSLVAYLIVRLRAEQWPPPGSPALPGSLWLSTLVILGVSVAAHQALKSVRRDAQGSLRLALAATAILAIVFLAIQSFNWYELGQRELPLTKHNMYGFTFYMLTWLHAMHVVGGLFPLAWTLVKAYRGAYNSQKHLGVWMTTVYWHFLDIVWVVMFTFLLIFS